MRSHGGDASGLRYRTRCGERETTGERACPGEGGVTGHGGCAGQNPAWYIAASRQQGESPCSRAGTRRASDATAQRSHRNTRGHYHLGRGVQGRYSGIPQHQCSRRTEELQHRSRNQVDSAAGPAGMQGDRGDGGGRANRPEPRAVINGRGFREFRVPDRPFSGLDVSLSRAAGVSREPVERSSRSDGTVCLRLAGGSKACARAAGAAAGGGEALDGHGAVRAGGSLGGWWVLANPPRRAVGWCTDEPRQMSRQSTVLTPCASTCVWVCGCACGRACVRAGGWVGACVRVCVRARAQTPMEKSFIPKPHSIRILPRAGYL